MAPLAQVTVMAAVVATLLYFPLGLGLALVLLVLGIAFEMLVTFGGAMGVLPGLALWWLVVFAAAWAYAACVFPWGDEVLAGPEKK